MSLICPLEQEARDKRWHGIDDRLPYSYAAPPIKIYITWLTADSHIPTMRASIVVSERQAIYLWSW